MKRIALLAIGGIALVAILVVAVSSLVSGDAIKQRIAENISALTGRDVVLKGTPVLAIYPTLAITVSDLTIANPAGMSGEPFLTSESVTASVQLLPLLFGSAQIEAIEFTKPRIHLVANAEGKTNWTLGKQSTKGATSLPPQRLKVTTGTVIYDDAAARHEELTEFDFDATWAGPGSPLTGTGDVRWRGELLEFNGQIGDPIAAVVGAPSPLRLALTGKPIRVSFNGTFGTSLNGTVAINTPALRRAIEWMGKPMGAGSTLGAASIKGKIDWNGPEIAFADATIDLDGSSAVGAFTVDFSAPRPLIAGTVAVSKLDLSPYIEAARSGVAGDASQLLAPIGLPVADAIDLDFGLSTDEAMVGAVRLSRLSGSVVAKGGRLTVSVGHADLYGGTLMGSLTLTKGGEILSGRAQAKINLIGAETAFKDAAGIAVVKGIGNADVDLSAQGATLAEFVQRLSGRGSFTLSEGSITGIDLADIAALPDASIEPRDNAPGIMEFSRMTGTAALDGGVLRTSDLVIRGNTYRIDLNGWGSILSGIVDARATLSPAGGAAANARLVPIAVSGTWRRPVFDLDRGRAAPASGLAPRG